MSLLNKAIYREEAMESSASSGSSLQVFVPDFTRNCFGLRLLVGKVVFVWSEKGCYTPVHQSIIPTEIICDVFDLV